MIRRPYIFILNNPYGFGIIIIFTFLGLVVIRGNLLLPPSHIVIEAGPTATTYYITATKVAKVLEAHGVSVTIRQKDQSTEIVDDVENPNSGIDVGFTSEGLSNRNLSNVTTNGSLELEPLFVFYKPAANRLSRLADLRGLSIELIAKGSVTANISEEILKEVGVTSQNSDFRYRPLQSAIEAFKSGESQALAIILGPDASIIAKILDRPDIHIMNIPESYGLATHVRYLHPASIRQASLDVRNFIPQEDLLLPATTADMLVRRDLHPTIVYLLLGALETALANSYKIDPNDHFPAVRNYQIPLNETAGLYYKFGVPWVYRSFPHGVSPLIQWFVFGIVPFYLILSVSRVLGMPIPMHAIRAIHVWILYRSLRRIDKRLARSDKIDENAARQLSYIGAYLTTPSVSTLEKTRSLYHAIIERHRPAPEEAVEHVGVFEQRRPQ